MLLTAWIAMNRFYGDFHRLGTGGWGQMNMKAYLYGAALGAGGYLITNSIEGAVGFLIVGLAIWALVQRY